MKTLPSCQRLARLVRHPRLRDIMRLGLLLLLGLLPAVGCAQGRLARYFQPQGSVQQQRLRATLHDPYPDQDLAPEMLGSRPRDYQRQLPEPVRSRYLEDLYWGWGRK